MLQNSLDKGRLKFCFEKTAGSNLIIQHCSKWNAKKIVNYNSDYERTSSLT